MAWKRYYWKVCLQFTLIVLVLVGCTSPKTIEVTDIWGRPSPGSAANAAFYMHIRNNGSKMEELVAADIEVCDHSELHESTVDENGVMRMGQVAGISIPPAETVILEPGGLHIMCINRQTNFNPGDRIPISLEFMTLGLVEVRAEIREN